MLSIREKCAKYEKLTFLLLKLSNWGLHHWTGHSPISTIRRKNIEIRTIFKVSVAVEVAESLFGKYYYFRIKNFGFFAAKFTKEWRSTRLMQKNPDFIENDWRGSFSKNPKNFPRHIFFIFEYFGKIFSPFSLEN